MKNFLLILTLVSCCFFNACTLQVKKDNGTDNKSSTGKIRNGIEIQENGLHAEQAFLLKEDGTLIPDDNKVQVGERVLLRLIVSGWTEESGVVLPEASEKISTSSGDVLLDEPALLGKSIPNGTTLENAKVLTLYATITQLDKLYDYFLVSFKVWDKKTNKSFSGSYKLHV